MRLVVLGAGAWGTALAVHAARRHPVVLWARDAVQVQAMADTRRNERGLPGVVLPEALHPESSLPRAIQAAGTDGLLVLATSVAGLRPVLRRLREPPGAAGLPLVWLCKGLERDTECLPHQVAAQELGAQAVCGALSGPSFAQEVAQGLPVALTVASPDAALRERAIAAFHHGPMRVYGSDDLVGVELAGALKNVMAIAAGICDGMRLGHNARAALISRGLAEMVRLGVAAGARAETFMGLSGMGDLLLTCTGDLSRNRQVGLGLAAGQSLDAVVAGLGHVAEGVPCARAARRLAAQHGVDMPIVDAVCRVLDGELTPAQALDGLVARQPREEGAVRR